MKVLIFIFYLFLPLILFVYALYSLFKTCNNFLCKLIKGHYSDNMFSNGFSLYSCPSKYQDETGRTVDLIPMVHIADFNFYNTVTNDFLFGSNMVLGEGVNDQQGLLKNKKVEYSRAANLLGFHYLVRQRHYAWAVNCDGDVGDHSQKEIESIKEIADLCNSETFEELMLKCKKYSDEYAKDKNKRQERKELLDKRNLILEKCFDSILSDQLYVRKKIYDDSQQPFKRKSNPNTYENMLATLDDFSNTSARYQRIAIPWGAAHMPYFHEMLKKKGFKRITSRFGQKKIRVLSMVRVIFTAILLPYKLMSVDFKDKDED